MKRGSLQRRREHGGFFVGLSSRLFVGRITFPLARDFQWQQASRSAVAATTANAPDALSDSVPSSNRVASPAACGAFVGAAPSQHLTHALLAASVAASRDVMRPTKERSNRSGEPLRAGWFQV